MFVSASTTLKFHEFPSGNIVHQYQASSKISGPIRSVSWSKDGKWLVFVPYTGRAEIISVKEKPDLIHTIQVVEEPSCASFQNTTRKNIAIGTKTGEVLIYDIKAKKIKKTLPKAASVITKVEFTARDSHVVAASKDGEAFIYSNVQNNLSGSFKIPRSQTISALRTNPLKRNYIVAGSDEGVVAVWDMHNNKHKFFNGSHKAPITGVAFSPVSPSLVVSTGLDRQFCFHDIAAGKCIGSIFVENNMTAVDFTPDGKYVIMASQKGKLYVYDVKNTHQPVYTYESHDGCIEHLSFRKCENHENSFSFSSDSIKVVDQETNGDQSLGVNIVMSPDPVNTVPGSTTAEDSFLAAMGIDRNSTCGSITNPSESREISLHNTPLNPSKILQEKIQSSVEAPVTSTPDLWNQGSVPSQSPISILYSDTSETIRQNLEQSVRTAVKEEVKILLDAFLQDLKNYLWGRFFEIRGMILDVLMFLTKNFMKTENHLNSIQVELAQTPQNDISVEEENFLLKQKIQELQHQIAILKMNDHH